MKSKRELLITLACLALIVGVLAAAGREARYKAQRAGCLANLRQLYLIQMHYANDHGGQFPWHEAPNPNIVKQPVNMGAGYEENIWNAYHSIYMLESRILICPVNQDWGGIWSDPAYYRPMTSIWEWGGWDAVIPNTNPLRPVQAILTPYFWFANFRPNNWQNCPANKKGFIWCEGEEPWANNLAECSARNALMSEPVFLNEGNYYDFGHGGRNPNNSATLWPMPATSLEATPNGDNTTGWADGHVSLSDPDTRKVRAEYYSVSYNSYFSLIY